jgi:hypothetical protein
MLFQRGFPITSIAKKSSITEFNGLDIFVTWVQRLQQELLASRVTEGRLLGQRATEKPLFMSRIEHIPELTADRHERKTRDRG